MEIGLLTIHNSVNPGAALQAAGLYAAIEKLGHDVLIIDYCPDYFPSRVDPIRQLKRQGIKGRVKAAVLGGRVGRKAARFNEYAEAYYPSHTRRFTTLEELQGNPPSFDVVVCGSDQIWNPPHVHYDEAWHFGFYGEKRPRLVSYAASIGVDELGEKDLAWLRKGASRFDAVGVREDTAVGILEGLGIPSEQNVDPTFLHEASWWREQEKKPCCDIPDRYVFYYPLQPNPIEAELVRRVSGDFAAPVVSLWSAMKKLPGMDVQISVFGPAEFLWLIDHAEAVVTNSFHGLAFSVIFQKKLVSFKNMTRNSRLSSLFRLLHLDGYQVSSIEEYNSVDWNERFCTLAGSASSLDEPRRMSEKFLDAALRRQP